VTGLRRVHRLEPHAHVRVQGIEWFSNSGTTSATVTYDLGSVLSLDRFALWNEEVSGIGVFNLLGSSNGTTFTTLLSGVSPADTPPDGAYPAQVFSFAAADARFLRLEMSGCPQPNGGQIPFAGCAIGEVAFRSAAVIPEPSTYALLGAGLAGLAGLARRRARTA
jgi:hypothetical protein